jgi:hypothetical protein
MHRTSDLKCRLLLTVQFVANRFSVSCLSSEKQSPLNPRQLTRLGSGVRGYLACAIALVVVGGVALAAEAPVLVPAPREVKWSAEAPASLASGTVAIVIGRQATAPEQHAAQLLQQAVSKRFGQQWPILREGEERAAHKTLVILGQRTTCARLDELCRKQGIELSESSPGFDGYVIAPISEGDRLLIVVGGCNARAVEYGQDTLFQMLRGSSQDLKLVRGVVRDAPVIPWRGRPQTQVSHYLRPGELDLYVLSRVNFIDLRSGIYAFQPGEKLDKAEIAEAVKQAHLRGIIVYATVNCGVPAEEYEKVMGTFSEMLDLGADGLWLSFDDKGPGGDPVTLTKRVLELGRQRQMTGPLIAITPPKGSYQRIVTDFNRKIMAVPGMEQALWFWTGVPSTQALEEARSIGIKVRPSWWHNWPRPVTPQTYSGVPPMSLGWSAPDYGVLAAGADCLEAVMPWGGNSYGQHYIVPVIDWWGWNPRGHDWNALRRRLFSIVFGEDQVPAAMKFDDQLQELFGLFLYSYKNTDDLPFCPPRLRAAADRQRADALIAELMSLLDGIAKNAPSQTLLTERELKSAYLNRMRQELETHRAAAGLAYPEDWWPEQQRKILDALYAGDTAGVDQITSGLRGRVQQEVEQISRSLPSYPHIKGYVDWWHKRASLDAKGWKALLEGRRKTLDELVRSYSRQIVDTSTMLDGLRSPPLEWGIGRWQVSNRLLVSVVPSPNEWFWGDWQAGVHEEKGIRAGVFATDRRMPGDVGEYGELHAVVPVSGRRDRLGLLVFASATNKDLFSNTFSKYRWAGYRFLELVWKDKVLWEADIGCLPERGDWFLVRLTRVPDGVKDLTLRLRIEDRKLSMNNYTLCFVGPIRLLELPE